MRVESKRWIVALFCLVLSSCAGKAVEQSGVNEGVIAQVSGAMDSDSGQAGGLESIHFDYRATEPLKSEQAKLSQAVDLLRAHPQWMVQIEGHGDQRGTPERNFAIADSRARGVLQFLRKGGIRSNRLSAISYGRTRLLDQGTTEEAMARNRRVNFVLLLQ